MKNVDLKNTFKVLIKRRNGERLLIVLLLLFLILFSACSKNPVDDKGDENTPEVPLTTIGPGGGTFSYGDFSLTVPPGAFSTNVTLEVDTIDINPFKENSTTRAIHLKGIPVDYSQPLKISLKYNGTHTENSYIAVGKEVFVTSLNKTETVYNLFPSTESSGRLECELPVLQDDLNKNGLNRTAGISERIWLVLTGITNYKAYITQEGHFEVDYPFASVPYPYVQELGKSLEQAYDLFQEMGFSYEKRKKWPVMVTVMALGEKTYGDYSSSIFGDDFGDIRFSTTKMREPDAIRVTAGHEFFHLVQALYDPRQGDFEKAKFSSSYLWLKEAASVWCEELFSNETDYCSAARTGNEDAPLYGAQYGAFRGAALHGYGMSALIKYLVDEYSGNNRLLVSIFQNIMEGQENVEAILNAIGNPDPEWWENFFRQYVLEEIYKDVDPMWWAGSFKGEFQINSEADSAKTFTDIYPDLSGKIYRIRLNYSISKLKFTVSGTDHKVTLFKYKRENQVNYIEYLDTSIGSELTISDVNMLKDDNWHILILVTNCECRPPFYILESEIDLKIEVENKEKVPYQKIWFKYYFKGKYMDGGVLKTRGFSILFHNRHFTDISDNTYTVSYADTAAAYGHRRVGNVIVTLNSNHDNIESVEFAEIYEKPDAAVNKYQYYEFSLKGTNVPLTYDGSNLKIFNITGEATGSCVSSVKFRFTENEKTFSVSEFIYDIYTSIEIDIKW